ncbi:hypothetical protein LSCM1_00461 [Leishmania martiniquensis]|uniref:PH domain-containing protein n=1 Tax=Leishmania martiniquensis TaxID=1580590 RepID=A0A836GFI3_9TRYP|nr:hypothetical protein LSCM1_00461 [Leishmania martiniquensis]
MEGTMSELVSQHGPTPHMGLLRCQMERRDRHSLKGYKKRFWVVDERNGRLEVYKNDQEHVPIQVFRAADIRNVIYADDKQNRFFVMVVQTRGPRDIKFRMGSFEERESWSKAITHIMDVYSAINKHKNVLGMVLRRAKIVSESLGVNISIDSGRLLSEVPENLLQYVAEAVDIALASVTTIVRAFRGEGVDMPRSYILYVHAVTEEQSPQHCKETKYSPEGRTMTMNVCLLRVKSERVSFAVTQPDEVFQLVQSNVFRNPVIEGWIESEPNCARVCADIQSYLGLPATRRSWITFQWGQHVSNSARVEAFLQRFVTVRFFERALQSVRDAVVRVERLIADTNAHAASRSFMGSSPAAPARDGVSSSPISARRAMMTSGVALQSDSAAVFGNSVTTASIMAGGFGGGTGGGGGNTAGFHSRQPSTAAVGNTAVSAVAEAALAIRLIRENVAGLCIQLEKRVVEKGTAPPPIVTLHASEYEQHCRPAFLLMTKCRRVLPLRHRVTDDVLSDELFEVAYNAFLQQQLSLLRTELNGIFHKQVKVVIMWDLLFRAAAGLMTPLSVEELPHLLRLVKDVCLSRLQHVVQVLRHAHCDVPGHVEDNNYLYNAFCTCVGTVVVNFLPFTVSSDASVLEPTLRAGVLTDTLYCTKEEAMPSLMAALGHAHRSGSKAVRASAMGTGFSGVLLYAAEAKLGAWCEKYFSDPEHAIPDTRRQLVEDEFDSDTDETSVATLQDPDFGEAVAYERSAEIRVLTMERVVNAIYDSQRHAPVDLKIGSDDILRAIHAFISAFGGDRRPCKHDVARVLIINLQRLRQMYVRAVDDETTSLLTLEQARQLLRDFCEYESNEQYIDAALREVSTAGTDTASPLVESPSRLNAESHEPAALSKAEQHIDMGENGGAVGKSGGTQPSPPIHGQNETGMSAVSSCTLNGSGTVRRSNRRPSMSRRRYSLSSKRADTTTDAHSRESQPGPSAPMATGLTPSGSGLHIRVPSKTPDAFDFASVTEVALTELLPREARLARLAWRVGFVFGLENTGKSLIINSMRGIARPTVATVGLSQQVVAFDEWVWALNELGGRESFRTNWRYYARRIDTVHFLMFVLDVLNEQALGEAYQYLKEVTAHYHEAPLLVVFNNFREGHRRFDIAEFEALLHLDKLRRRHGAPVLSCVCDITVVHSKNRQLPRTLSSTLRSLSSLLLARAKGEHAGDEQVPAVPKVTASSIPTSAVGGRAGLAPSTREAPLPLKRNGSLWTLANSIDGVTAEASISRPQHRPF